MTPKYRIIVILAPAWKFRIFLNVMIMVNKKPKVCLTECPVTQRPSQRDMPHFLMLDFFLSFFHFFFCLFYSSFLFLSITNCEKILVNFRTHANGLNYVGIILKVRCRQAERAWNRFEKRERFHSVADTQSTKHINTKYWIENATIYIYIWINVCV